VEKSRSAFEGAAIQRGIVRVRRCVETVIANGFGAHLPSEQMQQRVICIRA
jgi:hypothetical protein